jgi:hypothetical protein
MAVSAPPPPALDAGKKVSIRLPFVGSVPGTVEAVRGDTVTVILAVREVRTKRVIGHEGAIEVTSPRGIQRWPARLDEVRDGGVLVIRIIGELVKIQRREWARVPAALKVFVKVLDDPKLGGGDTMSLNLSGGGMLINDPWRLPVGVDLRLQIEVSEDEPPIRALARVVRDQPVGKKGIRFEDMSREDAERLMKLIRERERVALRITKDYR